MSLAQMQLVSSTIRMARVWAMPTSDTFDCTPIGEMVKRYLAESEVSIDPFARNKQWATYTNDLDSKTDAEYHMDAYNFLLMLHEKSVLADLIIFDPPYSPRQIKECYDGVGLKMEQMDAFRTHWKPERDLIDRLLKPYGIVLSFGWNTIGMGKNRPYQIEELLVVCHGPGHNDTLCLVERKLGHQLGLFEG